MQKKLRLQAQPRYGRPLEIRTFTIAPTISRTDTMLVERWDSLGGATHLTEPFEWKPQTVRLNAAR